MILRLILTLFIFCKIISLSSADIQPIDVDPVLKKEQPDFEDDTGDRSHGKEDVLSKEGVGKGDEAKVVAGAQNGLLNSLKSSTNLDFTHAFVATLSVIIVSELGDKTFFIAAIMAMTNPRLTVFIGAMSALTFMHILSALFGYVITYIPRLYTFYASAALFAFFGLKMIREGISMNPADAQEELEEVQMDLRRREASVSLNQEDRDRSAIVEEGSIGPNAWQDRRRCIRVRRLLPRVFLESFTLTFLAEWGDRSQIATVVMATTNNLNGIIIGGLLGHFLCTGLAVIGGKIIATKISVKTVTILGGIVFLVFAITTIVMGP